MDEDPENQEEAEYEEDTDFEMREDSTSVNEVPPTECRLSKYLREYRLLNNSSALSWNHRGHYWVHARVDHCHTCRGRRRF